MNRFYIILLPYFMMGNLVDADPSAGNETAPETGKAIPGNQAPPGPTSWRTRYELGPGDVLNFAFYGRPDLDRPAMRIGPDGTISYLQAKDIKLTGLTIDEARLKIEQALSKDFLSPRVILTPAEVASKRFTVLGKVVKRGVYTLERPMTLVEAVANAGGLETGLFEQNTIELADLDRSFLSRNGKRLPINFRRLFLEGKMDENVEIEPNDFIYLASNISNDYYVFGAVTNPGVQGLTPDVTVVSALSRRGGMTEHAWADRVLVVRGSFEKPETFEISVKDILAAKAPDFALQPNDIVYVADHPWTKAEEILKLALNSFVGSATSNWINLNVDPIITDPIIPGRR
ncbi:polysaccharide biosynthesis/export family protein [Luteolibacter pohnpeiensis]|uniref:Polysaccharide biosynthesis/export family protein n=1 Tax=Luteolibacter pohnpeiensis TaxID=454153 RepID=A0A934S703_9BACT|nr:polysaccharide biosynthesis/export family protein [Luteolibacter pohnpeiensis]MBK1882435.1 polysaccharide biosynthesis/export family protein [Luteolibacter pohnpeiensis]